MCRELLDGQSEGGVAIRGVLKTGKTTSRLPSSVRIGGGFLTMDYLSPRNQDNPWHRRKGSSHQSLPPRIFRKTVSPKGTGRGKKRPLSAPPHDISPLLRGYAAIFDKRSGAGTRTEPALSDHDSGSPHPLSQQLNRVPFLRHLDEERLRNSDSLMPK